MVNVEKITIENLENELKYIFNNVTEKNYKKLLYNFIKLIFNYNNFKISITTLKSINDINNFVEFIYINIDEYIIKNVNDLKFYIIDELNLIMPNNEYLYNRFLLDNENKGIYKEFNNNFEFVKIE